MASWEEDERAMARMASAFEEIADTLTAWYKLDQQRFEKEFPVKVKPEDATVTTIASDEDALREAQGASSEPLEEWTGQREQEFILKRTREAAKRPGKEKK
jgi:hypothetical protein